jgi:hypothetical protein
MTFKEIKEAAIRKTEMLGRMTSAMLFKSSMPSWKRCYNYLNSIHKDVKSSAIRSNIIKNQTDYKYDIAIIMTTYNREFLVERCIKSILLNVPKNENHKFEYIFVNDGSKDSTKEILEKYKKYPNVTVINQENQGVSGARNTAIDAARAEYLLFVDDDDTLMEGSVEKFLNVAEKGDYDIIEGSRIRVLSDGSENKYEVVKTGELENSLGVLKGFVSGKLLRKKIFDKIVFPEKYWFEDSIGSALIYGDHTKTYIIEDVVYRYYITDNSITASSDSIKNIDSIYVTMQLLKDRKVLGLPFKQENYEYFLRMINLTYQRTKKMNTTVRYCIFRINQYLYQEYYAGFKTERADYLKTIETALLKNNFAKYVKACEVHI